MQEYVVGFMIDRYANDVALINKNRPEWQAGKVNGIGGKIEPNELAHKAMSREFEEETGVLYHDWNIFAMLESPRSKIFVYRAFVDTETVWSVKTIEDEEVFVHSLDNGIPKNAVPNLHWLIPLAMQTEEDVFVEAHYA